MKTDSKRNESPCNNDGSEKVKKGAKTDYTIENDHKILHIPGEQDLKVATDEEIKEEVKRINPDTSSMESRG